MSVQFEVPLIRVRDSASIIGTLVTLNIKHLNDFRAIWREQLRTSADEDQYWDWDLSGIAAILQWRYLRSMKILN